MLKPSYPYCVSNPICSHNRVCIFVALCDVVSWQLGLVEREINDLLQGTNCQPTSSANTENNAGPAAGTVPPHSENNAGPAAGTVPQREITNDDICPICQEQLLANHKPVTFCRSDC